MIPIVFLPGMMCDARLFGPQIAAVSPSRAVHHAPLGNWDSMGDLAAEILSHAPPRFALAGLSMGGIVAMEVARQAPERLAGIALLDTNPLAEAEEVRAARGPQVERVMAGGLAEVMRNELMPNYLAGGSNRHDILDLCMDMALGLGPAVFRRQSQALRDRADRRETLLGLDIPALILCGRHDRLCPVSRHEMMADLMPHAAFEIVEEAGHLPTLECPDETNAVLLRWLEAI